MPSSRAASASAPGPMKAAASTPPASASSTPAASAASIPGSMAAISSPPLGKGHPCPASPPRPPPEDRGCERLQFIQIGLVVGMQEALQSLKLGLVAHRDAYDGLV